MIQVIKLFCILILYFISESDVNPFMQVLAHNVGLQDMTHLEDEFLWTVCPNRKDNVVHLLLVLLLS